MKVLFLSAWFPYPPSNGAKIRIYNLIKGLAEHHEIGLVSLAKTIEIEEARTHVPRLLNLCKSVDVFPAHKFNANTLSDWRGIFSPLPRSIYAARNPSMEKLMFQRLKEGAYDAVIASEVSPPSEISQMASCIEGVPVILDALEIGSPDKAVNRYESSVYRLRRRFGWMKRRRLVKKLLQNVAACTVPSELERQYISEIADSDVIIKTVPNCIDLSHLTGNFGSPQPGTIVFTGSFSYHANSDAVSYFLDEIFPLVRARRPDTRFQVLGSLEGSTPLSEQPNASVKFAGQVDDVRYPVAQAWLSVAPLRFGTGTRLKILESMALGTPVVSTRKGAEGLDVTHGEDILLADDPREFADAIARVIQNPDLRGRLSKGGQTLVREKYGANVMCDKLLLLLDQISASLANSQEPNRMVDHAPSSA